MEFIEPVLLGFLGRVFGRREGEEPARHEPHAKKIHAFIKDESAYWVREKALYVIYEIESAESEIGAGRYTPKSPKTCVEAVLTHVKEKIGKIVEEYRLESPNDRMHTFAPLPTFPNQTRPNWQGK
jgi:hypothetical protein